MNLKTIFIVLLAVGAAFSISKNFEETITNFCLDNKKTELANALKAADTFVSCVDIVINPTAAQEEFEAAKRRGALDEVFEKYCDKSPQLSQCTNNFMSVVTTCGPDELNGIDNSAIKDTIDKILSFACYRKGERIAYFMHENGLGCVQEKYQEIVKCSNKINDSMKKYKESSLKEVCDKYNEFQSCIVQALDKCSNPTASTLFESLFKYVKKNSPCDV